ncbi:MAG TPA: hypothetical protein VN643_11665 [Pyrinomonadaceae bacterium]|nr:hypothetical protein [Pyrinomonadaceae bacterium]
MSKTHFRLIALILSVALAGLMILAPDALAKKDKKKKKSTENYVYVPPTIQLTASPTVLTACSGQPAKVMLESRVSFPSGAAPRYRWSADGGRIAGNGATTEWDLTGAKPGYYKAFLEADNGVSEECAVFSSAIVRINCVPPTCPNITISCPDKVEIDQPLTFCVNTAGGTPGVRPVYEWTVSAGRISSGEGTNCITVDTTGLAGQSVRATLTMPGYSDLNCTASCLVQIPNELPKCRKFDEYTNITRNDEKARLDNYGIELQNDPTSTAYVVVYPGTSGKANEVQQRSNRVVDYLVNSRAIDKGRITVIISSPREHLMVELWVCPPGAKPKY